MSTGHLGLIKEVYVEGLFPQNLECVPGAEP